MKKLLSLLALSAALGSTAQTVENGVLKFEDGTTEIKNREYYERYDMPAFVWG